MGAYSKNLSIMSKSFGRGQNFLLFLDCPISFVWKRAFKSKSGKEESSPGFHMNFPSFP